MLEMTISWGGVNVKCGWSVHANLGKVDQFLCVCKRKNRGFSVCVFCLKPGLLQKEIWVGNHSGKHMISGRNLLPDVCVLSFVSCSG